MGVARVGGHVGVVGRNTCKRDREQWEIWPKIEVRPKEFHWRCKRARQRDATNLIEMPARKSEIRNEKWEMRDEHSERDLWWKIENRKWIYYDIRKTRKLWKPNGVGKGKAAGTAGHVQMRTRRTKLIFQNPPRPKNKKKPKRSNKYAACAHAHTRAQEKERESTREKERERGSAGEGERERSLTHSLEQQSCLIRHFWTLATASCHIGPNRTDRRSARSIMPNYCAFAPVRSLSLSLSLSRIVQRRGPPYAKDLFLGAIHRRDARLAMLCCCAEGGQISMSEAKHIAV